ncbi:beta-glucosidase-like protein [Setomelanomma holmii]|uniref:beta-glucosidase n=1 Tax=Setomelanomma holmii TaxID=210430 RepID=A0A9P4HF37_9PLEO|nr:beta-glucosidase-like protein [Setomelanomma holmii]
MANQRRSLSKRTALAAFFFASATMITAVNIPASSSIHHGRFAFRSTGTVDLPYRDASLSVDERVEDILQRMTIEEKAGQLFQNILTMGANGTFANGIENSVVGKLMTHFNLAGTVDNTRLHEQRWNCFTANSFSQRPESLGPAAIRDAKLVHSFADIVRQKYMAIGLRSSLHPQINLATEPRWVRISGTVGVCANLTAELVVSYIKGFTGPDGFGPNSVTTVTKHFPGSGPGKNTTYPIHLIPFKAAIATGTRQMMPYNSRPIGTKYEEVASEFNKDIINGLLKEELGFQGIVVSDWGLITDAVIRGQDMPAQKILNAGVDQLGGEQRIDLILELVQKDIVSEARIDVSVGKLLHEKFLLLVGKADFVRQGAEAQRKAYTLLTNNDNVLPLKSAKHSKFYIESFNKTYMESRNLRVVDTLAEADMALVRLQAPYVPRPGDFENVTEQALQVAIYQAVPKVVDMYLDRPAAIPEAAEQAKALMANYGASTDAFLDIVFATNGSKPLGRLPFDLPRSMAAVEASKEDVPFDTENPVFRYG